MGFWSRLLTTAVTGTAMRLVFRLLAGVAACAAVASLLAVLLSLGGRAYLVFARSNLDTHWRETAAPLSSLPDRVLPHEANQTARELEKLAAGLGIDLAPLGSADRVHPSDQEAARLQAVTALADAYTRALMHTEDALPLPSSELAAGISQRLDALDDIVQLLTGGTSPRWDCDITLGPDAPRPQIAGHQSLQRLLTVAAVTRLSRGEAQDAQSILEASWQLNQQLLQRPELDCLLAGLLGLKLQMALTRRVDPDPVWLPRFEQLDLIESLRTTVATAAYTSEAFPPRCVVLPENRSWSWLQHLVNPLARPFDHLAMTDLAHTLAQALDQLAESDVKEFERGEFFAQLQESMPRWNRLARRALPELGSVWLRIQRTRLDIELSMRVLQARELFTRIDAEGIPELAGVEPALIEGLSWRYTPAGRALKISLEPVQVAWPEERATLPFTVTVPYTTPSLTAPGG